MSNAYIEASETLYYLCRLDRYTPITAKFISWGTEVVTPLTQDELISVILENYERDDRMRRRFYQVGVENLYERPNNFDADNNHSGYWSYGYVHAIGRHTNYWNLDAPLTDVLQEVANIDRTALAELARDVLMELLEKDDLRVTYMTRYVEFGIFEWLETKMENLPPRPDPDPEKYDSSAAEKYYDAFYEDILQALKDEDTWDQDLITLIQAYCTGPDVDQGQQNFRKDNLMRHIVYDVVPQKDKADGYIINGMKTLIPSDAMRGSIYIGNICDVLDWHFGGQALTGEIQIEELVSEAYPIKDFSYPQKMQRGMPSDWLTDGPYSELSFVPHKNYPQMGTMSVIMAGYELETEKDAICDSSTWQRFNELSGRYKYQQPQFVPQVD